MSATAKSARRTSGRKSSKLNRNQYKKTKDISETDGTEVDNESDDTEANIIMPMHRRTLSFVQQKGTVMNVLNEEEQVLCDLVSTGKVSEVESLLNQTHLRNVDINKPNFDGYTFLQIAVQREDEEMVELLMQIPNIDIKDTLFLAIKEDNLELVRMIVDFVAGDQENTSDRDRLGALEICKQMKDRMTNSEFDEDITALILAAHTGSYQLIEYFYSLGERLPEKPYQKNFKPEEILIFAFKRLTWYSAICNPSYIVFMANEDNRLDPILQAFNLSDELQNLANIDPEFRNEYEELVLILKEFTGDLLGLCRTSEEVDLVCCQKEGYNGKSSIPRLLLAVESGQSDFVAHPYAQNRFYQNWVKGFQIWPNFHPVIKFLIFLAYMIGLPFISAFIILNDCFENNENMFRSPVSRFLQAVASHSIFLILLLLAIFLPYDIHDPSPSRRIGLSIIHCFLVAFVIGNIIAIVKQFNFMRKYYVTLLWHWYEMFTQVVFLVTFSLWLWAWLEAPAADSVDHGKLGERMNWPNYHPLLIAECFFALGTILSFGRVLRIFQLHSRLGPLQIALGYMIRDFGKGAIFYAMTIFSFATGFCMLYKSYKDVKEDATNTTQHAHFTTFPMSFESLIWGLFGLMDVAGLDIVSNNETKIDPLTHNVTGKVYHPFFTQWTGKFLYKIFQVLNVLMFSNVIVSMMSNTAGAVFEDKEREWKFSRTQVRLFLGHSTPVASPFNIFYFRYDKEKKKVDPEEDRRKRAEYSVLIKSLLQRYIREKKEEGQDDPATVDQVTRIREDVAEMKDKCKSIARKVIFVGNRDPVNRHRLSMIRRGVKKASLDTPSLPKQNVRPKRNSNPIIGETKIMK